MFVRMFCVLVLVICPLTVHAGTKSAPIPKGLALEVQPKDAKAAKIVFIAGSNYYKPGEHEYIGGCAVLMDLVKQTPGVAPVLALDWPKNPETLSNVRSIVFLVDGAEKHTILKGDRLAQMQKLADAGVGIVMFHQGVDIPKDHGDRMRSWMAAAWEKGHSQRGHWIDTYQNLPKHPITNGVTPFKIDDGYLFKLKFVADLKGVTPLLRAVNPKAKATQRDDTSVVAWAFERKAGRSFAFTGGHLHVSLAEEGYRRFLTNGILWSANIEIPTGGAPVALTTAELNRYIETRPVVKGK